MPSSLANTTDASPQPAESGTRHVFLRPLPGDQQAAGDSAQAAETRDQGAERSVLSRLFGINRGDDSDQSDHSAAGVRIGHFVIEERIGQGGMGAVFRAVDERLNRVVALKVLAPAFSRDRASVERFENEARAAARLDHENIARVHYIGEDQGAHFIAFEFIRGTNVREFILQKGMLSPVDSVNYAMQVAQALRHTHAAGVVHRDIKPSNIIITPAGRAKLVDLGLARQQESGRSQDLTVDGTTLGTFDYIAPEQAIDPRQVDVRADIYSLGCTLYHMLTGEPPFPAGTMFKKVVDHHRDAPPDPADRNPLVSPQLSRIVRRMMASNPDERYATPDHVIQDLTQVALELGLRPMHAEDVIWVTPLYEPRAQFWERNRGWLVTLALLLVIALGVNRVPWPGLADDEPATDLPRERASAQFSPEDAAGGNDSSSDVDDPDDSAPPAPRNTAIGLVDGVHSPSRNLAIDSTGVGFSPSSFDSQSNSQPNPDDPSIGSRDAGPSRIAAENLDQELRDFLTPLPGRRGDGDAARPATISENPFVVLNPDGGDDERFSTLAAACQAAPDGARIELQFDGLLLQPQPPVRIQNKKLVIRARKGARPAVEFVAPKVFGTDDVTRMIGIEGQDSSLQIYDVTLVVPVETSVSDRWAVFSMEHSQKLEMRGVEVVVKNPNQLPSTIVEFEPPRSRDSEMFMPERMTQRQSTVDWKDCVVRGQSDLIVHSTLDPISVNLENTALAIRGVFAWVGGLDMSDRTSRSNDDSLSFSLRHVTAVASQGMLRLEAGLGRDFLPINFSCEDSAIVVRPGNPLMVMSGEDDAGSLRNRLFWRSDTTYYDVDGVALEIDTFVERTDVAFAEFHIGSDQLIEGRLLKRTPRWSSKDFSTWKRSDFELQTTPNEPLAADGGLAGIRWSAGRVPPLDGDESPALTDEE